MANLCLTERCTGCGACVNTCPKDCIQLSPDDLGRLVWSVNTSKCIDCRNCEKVCPEITPPVMLEPKFCAAAMRFDTEKLERCASGGVATFLMERLLKD